MNNQPSLWGIKNIIKPPMSLHAKPLNSNVTLKERVESQPPLIETNNVEPKHLPFPELIPLPQRKSRSNIISSAINEAMYNTTPLRQENNNINLTNTIIKAIKSPTTRSPTTVTRDMELTKLNNRCQTDYEISLSNESTEIMSILRHYDINKDILLNILHGYIANINSNESELTNNDMQILNLDGEESDTHDEHSEYNESKKSSSIEFEDEIERNDDILDPIQIQDDVNKIFNDAMYSIDAIKAKTSNLTKKDQENMHQSLIKRFCSLFNAELRGDLAFTADNEAQTVINDGQLVNPNKRRYEGIPTKMTMDNAQRSIISTINNIAPQNLIPPPPPPPQQAEQLTQEQQWLRYYNSMDQHVQQEVQNQKSKQNLSTYYAPNGQTRYNWIYPSHLTGGCGRNVQKINHVDDSQGFSRQAGWCNNQEQINPYPYYGPQYLQQYNTYPQYYYTPTYSE